VSSGELSPAAARRLLAAPLTALDPARGPAIKRNLHELVVGAEASAFAAALEDVIVRPGAVFAGITLLRLPGRVGRPFTLGERLRTAIVVPRARRLGERWLGDSAVIDRLERGEAGGGFLARYRYLDGAPLAGSSTLRIEPLGPGRARFTACFEFQERGLLGVEVLHRFGVRAHDRAVLAQVQAAAAALGASVLASSVRA
jgi:hypothetical protein